jgi:hypothetical protein
LEAQLMTEVPLVSVPGLSVSVATWGSHLPCDLNFLMHLKRVVFQFFLVARMVAAGD